MTQFGLIPADAHYQTYYFIITTLFWGLFLVAVVVVVFKLKLIPLLISSFPVW